jgi:predicted RNA polymerase sigma factor
VGLELLASLDADGALSGHHRLAAVRGHLLDMAGERDRAVAHYRAAADGTASRPERDYLLAKAARLAIAG